MGTPQYLKPAIYQYRDALERFGSVVAISLDGKLISASDSFEEMLGYTEQELIGQPLYKLNYGTTMPAFFKQMWEKLEVGETWMGDVPCRHQCGECVMARVSVAPSIVNGKTVGYLAQYQAINAKRLSNGLPDILYRYRAGFNSLAALAVISRSGEVQEINELFVDLYGYARNEIIGHPVSMLRSHNTAPSVFKDLWATILAGKVWSGEIENRCKDGSLVSVRATISPTSEQFADANENAVSDTFLVIYQDISTELALRHKETEMAIEAGKQDMLAGALHNIGNLQQSVMAANDSAMSLTNGLAKASEQAVGYFPKLAAEQQGGFFTNVMNIIQKTTKDILEAQEVERKAIEDTVSVLRSFRQQQRNITVVEEGNLNKFTQEILSSFSLQAATYGISISVSEMPENDQVRWPLARVHQIIFNLLKNAKEAEAEKMEAGSLQQGYLDLSVVSEGDFIVISITDNGGGFTVPENKLFAQGFTTKHTGSGIGLHNAAIQAQSMGGALSAKNVTFHGGAGAQFTLRLPRFQESRADEKSK